MSRTGQERLASSGEFWLVTSGSLLVGLAVCVFMPPLILAIIVALGVRDLTRSSLGTRAGLSGFGVAALLYLALALAGGVNW
jgi:hypothetical protein